MQAALSRLSDRWEAEGLPRQEMRIGINTGPASVGNMGSSRRFAYTALGDAVNLAARLEPLNNEYGTNICVSQNTLDAVDDRDARCSSVTSTWSSSKASDRRSRYSSCSAFEMTLR